MRGWGEGWGGHRSASQCRVPESAWMSAFRSSRGGTRLLPRVRAGGILRVASRTLDRCESGASPSGDVRVAEDVGRRPRLMAGCGRLAYPGASLERSGTSGERFITERESRAADASQIAAVSCRWVLALPWCSAERCPKRQLGVGARHVASVACVVAVRRFRAKRTSTTHSSSVIGRPRDTRYREI